MNFHGFDDDDDLFGDDEDLIDPENDGFFQLAPTPPTTAKLGFIARTRDKVIDFFSKHPTFISNVQSVISTIVEFNTPDINGRKEPLKIFNGALSFVEGVKNSSFASAWSFLSSKNGFESLFYKKINVAFLFKELLPQYPCRSIKFLDNQTVQIYTLPICELYFFKYSQTEHYIYFNRKKIDQKTLLNFLVAEKLKSLNSNFITYYKDEATSVYAIKAFNPNIKSSVRASEMTDYVKKFIDAGMNRSMLFYGPAGTGKTTLAHSSINTLNYKTLIFSASYDINKMATLEYIVELFGIEALVIDDFDQLGDSGKQLDLLEMLNRKLKLVVGIANSLAPFHPAVLRPGRFDEVILVDTLDEECIMEVLGPLTKKYLPLVKHWPIAYINELAKRSKFDKGNKLKQHYEELNTRVLDQLDALKG